MLPSQKELPYYLVRTFCTRSFREQRFSGAWIIVLLLEFNDLILVNFSPKSTNKKYKFLVHMTGFELYTDNFDLVILGQKIRLCQRNLITVQFERFTVDKNCFQITNIELNNFEEAFHFVSCEYIGMTRDFVPKCEEKGEEKLITDDDSPGVCQINKKREDAEWGEWEAPEIVTGHNFIERQVFSLFPMADFLPEKSVKQGSAGE